MSSPHPSLRPLLLPAEAKNEVSQNLASEESSLPTFDWRGRPAAPHFRELGGKKTLFFTTGTICLWFTASFGIYFNFVLFFRNVLGEGSSAAASDTTSWLGSMFLFSLLGAFLAESFLGRLWACALFQSIAVVGLILTVIATAKLLSTETATGGTKSFFYVSIYLFAIGCGAFQPAFQSLGADQFSIDGEKASFFTLYLIFNNLGLALADTLVVYVVSAKGWLIGFGLAMLLAIAGLVVFLSGLPLYRQFKHKGNPYQRALQVLVAAARKWRVSLPKDSSTLYEEFEEGQQLATHTYSLRWLDKAATTTLSDRDGLNKNGGSTRNGWRLSTVTEVEEMKSVLRLVPIWASCIFLNTIYSQAATLLVEEGATMNTSIVGSLTMEPATMNLFNILVVVLVAPLYNATVVPLTRCITGLPRGLSPLHRIGLGYIVSVIVVALAAIVEAYRLRCRSEGLAPPSIFWQVPEFLLLGFAHFLAAIGQLEFFYMYAPPSLRSLGSSFYLTCIALGNYGSSLLVWAVTLATTRGGSAGWIAHDLDDGHLDYFFWLLAGLTLFNFVFFTACAISFMRQQTVAELCKLKTQK